MEEERDGEDKRVRVEKWEMRKDTFILTSTEDQSLKCEQLAGMILAR